MSLDFLTPAPAAVLAPTPGRLADILHVEISTGEQTADTTYGTDTYGAFDYGGMNEWQKWDCDITTLSLGRGRTTRMERNSPGVCSFTAVQTVPAAWLTNPPTARPARVVTASGAVVFLGIIEAAELTREWGAAEWSVTIVDDLARLGRLEVATLVRPVEEAWQRVDALLGVAGMLPQTDPYKTYPLQVQAVNGSGRKVLDEMGIAVDTWRWTLATELAAAPLVARTGKFTVGWSPKPPPTPGDLGNQFRNDFKHPWRISPAPSPDHAENAHTWIGDAMNVSLLADLSDLRNYLTFSNAGGTAVVTQDTPSVTTHGPRSYQRLDLIGAGTGATGAAYALEQWAIEAMEPQPKMRLKTVSVDCWYRPAGAAPLEALLANLDVTHLIEIELPDQDNSGGDISLEGIPGQWYVDGGAAYIYGLTWDLADREAMLTLTIDRPIVSTP